MNDYILPGGHGIADTSYGIQDDTVRHDPPVRDTAEGAACQYTTGHGSPSHDMACCDVMCHDMVRLGITLQRHGISFERRCYSVRLAFRVVQFPHSIERPVAINTA